MVNRFYHELLSFKILLYQVKKKRGGFGGNIER